jgi:hypothetical protein
MCTCRVCEGNVFGFQLLFSEQHSFYRVSFLFQSHCPWRSMQRQSKPIQAWATYNYNLFCLYDVSSYILDLTYVDEKASKLSAVSIKLWNGTLLAQWHLFLRRAPQLLIYSGILQHRQKRTGGQCWIVCEHNGEWMELNRRRTNWRQKKKQLTSNRVFAINGAIACSSTVVTAGRTASQGTDVFEAGTTHRPLIQDREECCWKVESMEFLLWLGVLRVLLTMAQVKLIALCVSSHCDVSATEEALMRNSSTVTTNPGSYLLKI